MALHSPPGSDGPERRAQERHNRSFPTKIQVGFENYRQAKTLDISLSGARLELQMPVLTGSKVALSLAPEPLRHVNISGEIVWLTTSSKDGVFEAGVRFHNAGRSDRVWLEKNLQAGL